MTGLGDVPCCFGDMMDSSPTIGSFSADGDDAWSDVGDV